MIERYENIIIHKKKGAKTKATKHGSPEGCKIQYNKYSKVLETSNFGSNATTAFADGVTTSAISPLNKKGSKFDMQ